MKPITQFSDEHLRDRLQGLAKNLFFADGQLFILDDARPAFSEAYEEAMRRGPTPRLDVEALIDPKDPKPTFHSRSIVRYAKAEHLREQSGS